MSKRPTFCTSVNVIWITCVSLVPALQIPDFVGAAAIRDLNGQIASRQEYQFAPQERSFWPQVAPSLPFNSAQFGACSPQIAESCCPQLAAYVTHLEKQVQTQNAQVTQSAIRPPVLVPNLLQLGTPTPPTTSSEESGSGKIKFLVAPVLLLLVIVIVCIFRAPQISISNKTMFYKAGDLMDGSQKEKEKEDIDMVQKWAQGDLVRKDLFGRMLLEAKDHITQGQTMKLRGELLYWMQLTAGATVPVLVAQIGAWNDSSVDSGLQLDAVILSVVTLMAKNIEDVYFFRDRGIIRIDAGQQMFEALNKYYIECQPKSFEHWSQLKESLLAVPDVDAADAQTGQLSDELVAQYLERPAFTKLMHTYQALAERARTAINSVGGAALPSGDEHKRTHEQNTPQPYLQPSQSQASRPPRSHQAASSSASRA